MATLLQIKSSLFGDNGNSSQLANEFVERWKTQNPNGEVVIRDFAKEDVPHLDATRVQALFTPAEQRTAEQQAVVEYSDKIIAEIQAADAIVLGVPLYNFGIPSTLKAYFDHIARAGVTFKYTETGPVGLLTDKPVYILAARGGIYKGQPSDTQSRYLVDFLNFVGLKDIHFIYAEGLNMGQKDQAFASAKHEIEQEIAA
ncbi:FMN-dependent NADH-azoreductase [Cellvibrio japonicus]|uniref:FMN-dependent NADH:quinone oxidoreductase n=1 Tax=Cellvibrio japonicus (strain Ueda107) TaxID=498211 RepID=AZOR_CELJU|nr:NAD(P)H-dependent oxidoreductase [Cellvibrio japonicus]B3PKG0.1 RecName: Full=FMN-dependent NADH:quinone oxidoreductase; AltName: Full=Azo-dye reductase; AltName: Full=FMN-dependent NADH-azo compound oxidoreductase; AltName: Full=FMN-dependent NADH-azoreductase [Cellvibrio japonicus Ueda107]ACE85549.1 Flavodoxin-like fold subfamily [Cellvibrio japonicus Ueda107]QEI12827.1 FMN-dependent NADH-azoreductase [Cellvibrio japonicus]QEI16401.1 FMN-dependent NADH-azoreductase [Cellvibrio japonicus]Q